MRKTIPLTFLLTAALSCSAMAFAASSNAQGFGGHGGWHGHGHGDSGLQGLRKLNLTDAQKASIKQLVQQNFAANKPQITALRQQRSALAALTPDAPGYQSQAASLAQAEAAATSARITQRAALNTQIYALLTSTQKAQLATQKAAQQARQQQWQQFKAQNPTTTTGQSTP